MRYFWILSCLIVFSFSARAEKTLVITPVDPDELATIQPVKDAFSVDQLATIAALRMAAEKGDNFAPCALADSYAKGNGVEPDYIEAYRWLTICATKPLSDGPMRKIESERATIEKSMKPGQIREARRRVLYGLGSRARAGDGLSQLALGRLYTVGLGFSQNYEEAYYWYRLAANGGHINTIVAKEFVRQAGERLTPAQVEAVEKRVTAFVPSLQPVGMPEIPAALLTKAKGGDSEALCQIGKLFFSYDDLTAAHWYMKAAAKGYAPAQWMLSVIYGIQSDTTDLAESFKWARLAALQDIADAQAQLGYDYGSGKGVEQDEAEAYFWWSLAAAKSPEKSATAITAQGELGRLGKKLTSVQKEAAARRVREWRPSADPK